MKPLVKVLGAAVLGLALGVGATLLINPKPDAPAAHAGGDAMQASMDAMTASLMGKTGDAFDQAFLSEMIMHHEGAVAMAQLALTNAGHPELKAMANEIIAAQTAEISQMQTWSRDWFGDHSAH